MKIQQTDILGLHPVYSSFDIDKLIQNYIFNDERTHMSN